MWASACDLFYAAAGLIAPETEEGEKEEDKGKEGGQPGRKKEGVEWEGEEGQKSGRMVAGGCGNEVVDSRVKEAAGGDVTAGVAAGDEVSTDKASGTAGGAGDDRIGSRGSEHQGKDTTGYTATGAAAGEGECHKKDRVRGGINPDKDETRELVCREGDREKEKEADAVAIGSCVHSARRDAMQLIDGVQRLISMVGGFS